MKRATIATKTRSTRSRSRSPFAVSRFEVTFEEWDACVAPGRLRVAGAGNRLGTRHAAGDECELGRRQAIRGVAVASGPASPIGCCPRRNGSMRRAPAATRPIPGATRSARAMPTATAAAAMGLKQTAPVGSFAAQCVRPSRHARQCLGVGGGLLPRELQRGARGWLAVDRRMRSRSPCHPRRFLAQRSTDPPRGLPLRERRRRP